VPPSAWDDHFEALGEYLESVRIAVAVGRLAAIPPRLSSRPSGPLPEVYDEALRTAVAAIERMIGLAEAQRDDVARRRRGIHRRDRPTTTPSRLIDYTL
jgi:hypothetical protein